MSGKQLVVSNEPYISITHKMYRHFKTAVQILVTVPKKVNMPHVVLGSTSRVPGTAIPESEVLNVFSASFVWLCGDYCTVDLRVLKNIITRIES